MLGLGSPSEGVGDLVEARYPLDDAVAALERAGAPGVLKVLIAP